MMLTDDSSLALLCSNHKNDVQQSVRGHVDIAEMLDLACAD